MNRFYLDDDIFSPIRNDTSIVDENSEDSIFLTDLSSTEAPSLADISKDKVTLEGNGLKSSKSTKPKSKDKSVIKPEYANSCTPVTNKNSIDSSKVNSEKLKGHVNSPVKKGNKEIPKRKGESYEKNILDAHVSNSSNLEKLYEKKFKEISGNISDTKVEKSAPNTESLGNSSNSELKKSNKVFQQIENVHHDSHHDSCEVFIRRMMDDEFAKIRQFMYMQRMFHIREMNKLRDEMNKRHLVTTEKLFQVIEELMQMNASLSALSDRK